MLARNILDHGCLASNLNEFLARVPLLVQVPDVAGSHSLVERDISGKHGIVSGSRDSA